MCVSCTALYKAGLVLPLCPHGPAVLLPAPLYFCSCLMPRGVQELFYVYLSCRRR